MKYRHRHPGARGSGSICYLSCILHVPADAECTALMTMNCNEWLQAEILTQRHLPVSVTSRVCLALQQLWQIGMEPQFSTSQRYIAHLLVLLAPRWCWREPTREKGKPLAPHSRPTLIKRQLALLETGQWNDLFLSMRQGVEAFVVPAAAPAFAARSLDS